MNTGEVLDENVNAGLHNVSLSNSPGCLWLSLQYANTLLLVDVKNLNANGAPTILNEYKAFERYDLAFHIFLSLCSIACMHTT